MRRPDLPSGRLPVPARLWGLLLASGLWGLIFGGVAWSAEVAAADEAPASGGIDAEAGPPMSDDPALVEALGQLAVLRRRRIDDLRRLMAEVEVAELPDIQLRLAEVLVESVRALQAGQVPDAPTAIAAREALEQERLGEAIELLREAWLSDAGDALRDGAGLSLGSILQLQGQADAAGRVLAEVERTATTPRVAAIAAERRARLLEATVDLEAQRKALAAYERALTERPTVANRLGAARAAAQVGELDRALAHYEVLLRLSPAADDIHGLDARRHAASTMGVILSRGRPAEEGIARVEAQGAAGGRVWRSLGESLRAQGQHAGARLALERAVASDPTPRGRILARCALVDLGLETGERDVVRAQADGLVAALVSDADLDGDLPARIEQSLRVTVAQIHSEPAAAWPDDFVGRVIGAYLEAFPQAEAAPLVRLARGHRLIQGDPDCDTRQRAAADMIHAFRHGAEQARQIRLDAGVAAVQVLAGCRPSDDAPDGRPQTSPVDGDLLALANEVIGADPGPHAEGPLWLVTARIKLARGADETARTDLDLAMALDGDHLDEVALMTVTAWSLGGRHKEAEARALRASTDQRLSPSMRTLMLASAADAALADAQAVDGLDRARRLMRFAARYTESPQVVAALLEAARLFQQLPAGLDAHDALNQARAIEARNGEVGPAHVQLAALLDAQGDFETAAGVYAEIAATWASARPPGIEAEAVEAMRERAALRWRALGRWMEATAVWGEARSAARATARLRAARSRLWAGDFDGARRLGAAIEHPDAGQEAQIRVIAECQSAAPQALLERARRAPAVAPVVADCLASRLEAGLALPLPPTAMERAQAIRQRMDQEDAWVVGLRELGQPAALARGYLVIARRFDGVADAYASASAESSDTIDTQIARLRAAAWQLWGAAAPISVGMGIDGVLSASFGRTTAEIAGGGESTPDPAIGSGERHAND